ncbi:MAG: TRAP transporter substrate-binding protein [Candidatus Competibacterales bacterium]
MKRRDFITSASAGTLGAAVAAPAIAQSKVRWKMVTTWPKNFPGLGTGAEYLAELIGEMSGGRLEVRVYGGGELVPPLEAFDAVSGGTAEMGHGAAYYWKGKSEASQFFAAVPFGLNAQEMNGWLYHGGGLELWREVYGQFGLMPLVAGNTGVQMGGWFNKEINNLEDIKGLKMRIPGLAGEVLRRAGGTPVLLPGGEIYQALESGTIDATEWVGPYNDLAFGLHRAAKYYYYPGWHEPGTTIETFVNQAAFDQLPADLQAIVRGAAQAANTDMLAVFTARNNQALQTLIEDHGVELRQFPEEVLSRLKSLADEVVAEVAEQDAMAKKVFESFAAFRSQAIAWHDVSERAYLNARATRTVKS